MPDDSQEPDPQQLHWLQRMFLRFGAKRQGDVVIAHIGPGATNVAVGKNIIQVGSVQIPFWAIFTVALAVVVAALFSLSGFAVGLQTLRAVRTPPTPTAVPLLPGSFNVVVAQFEVAGEGEGKDVAGRLIQEVANAIELDLREGELGKIGFLPPSEAGIISGASEEERAANARAVAEARGADVVLYGTVEVDGLFATIKPEFYVNDSVNDGLVEASEITGQYQMGSPIPVERINNGNRRDQAAATLLARFQVLIPIIDGLSAYVVGDYQEAQQKFEQALDIGVWDNVEVIYVMLGNAALKQNLYDEAEANYQSALSENEKYSRAYIGLGSALYGKALGAAAGGEGSARYQAIDRELLDQAIAAYQRAHEPGMDRPLLADVEAKANFGLGQAYFMRALIASAAKRNDEVRPDWSAAEQALQRVIDAYGDGENERLQELAAHSHARLGLMLLFARQPERAIEKYELALALLPKLERTRPERAEYEARLGGLFDSLNDLEEARKWYTLAVQDAPAESDAREGYQQQLDSLSGEAP